MNAAELTQIWTTPPFTVVELPYPEGTLVTIRLPQTYGESATFGRERTAWVAMMTKAQRNKGLTEAFAAHSPFDDDDLRAAYTIHRSVVVSAEDPTPFWDQAECLGLTKAPAFVTYIANLIELLQINYLGESTAKAFDLEKKE